MPRTCQQSAIFDPSVLTDPLNPNATPVIDLCDRVPPGFYVIARTGDYATAAAQAAGMGMAGIIFLLGDTENTPEMVAENPPADQHIARRLVFRPDDGTNAQPWQKFQKQMLADQASGTVPGPAATRGAGLVCGGLFVLGRGGFDNPSASAQEIAAIRNALNLDFVLVDIDDPAWQGPFASNKALVIAQHVQDRYTPWPKLASGVQLSHHYPTFFVLPKTTTGYDNLVVQTSVADPADRYFAPTNNGYSGVFTFCSPRIPAGANINDVAAAWQWAKPWGVGAGSDSFGISRCEFVIDCRNGGDANETVNLLNKKGPVSVQFHNQTKNWTPQSGMVIFDDLDHFPGVAADKPTTYWDYDGQTPMAGTLVPAWSPDPIPLGIVDQDFQGDDGSLLTLRFENWKTGHLDQKNIPNEVFITNPNCEWTQNPMQSWLRINGAAISAGPVQDTYFHTVAGNEFVFSGMPLKGDEGPYPLLMEFRGSQGVGGVSDNDTQLAIVIEVLNPDIMHDPLGKSSTGIPILYADIPSRPAQGGGLHPVVPRSASRFLIPQDWSTAAAWCPGTKPAVPSKPLPPREHERPRQTITVCGQTAFSDVILALFDACDQFGVASTTICGNWTHKSEYAGFAFALIAAISGWDPLFDDGTHFGLWGLQTTSGPGAGHTVDQLKNPVLATGLVSAALSNAFLDGFDELGFTCGGAHLGDLSRSYQDRMRHAMCYFADAAGYYPGAHGGDLNQLSTSPYHFASECRQDCSVAVPWLSSTAGSFTDNATCFRDYTASGQLLSQGGGSGGGGGGGGGGLPSGGGGPDECCPPTGNLSICQMLALAVSVGFSNSNHVSPGGSSAQTIVEIALAESGGRCCGPDNVNKGGSIDRGILQFNSQFPPVPTSADCAYTPTCAFQHAISATNGVNFGAWATYLSGSCPGHAYCQFIAAVQGAQCS